MTKACNQELYSFSAEAPGPGKLYDVLADADSDEFFAGEVEGTLIYDFSPLLENATKECEAEGGRLYKYSDHIVYFDGASFQYLNGPICIGSSCDVEKYFDEVFEPALTFFLTEIVKISNSMKMKTNITQATELILWNRRMSS